MTSSLGWRHECGVYYTAPSDNYNDIYNDNYGDNYLRHHVGAAWHDAKQLASTHHETLGG